MSFALIFNGMVVDKSEKTFEVVPQMEWVECAEDVEAYMFTYEDGVFTAIEQPTPLKTE